MSGAFFYCESHLGSSLVELIRPGAESARISDPEVLAWLDSLVVGGSVCARGHQWRAGSTRWRVRCRARHGHRPEIERAGVAVRYRLSEVEDWIRRNGGPHGLRQA